MSNELTEEKIRQIVRDELSGVSRRDVMAGGAGLLGLGGLLTAGAGTASADPDSTQVGTFGNGDEDWDVEDITANHLDGNSADLTDEDYGLVLGSSRPTRLFSGRTAARESLTVQPTSGDHPGSVETYPSGTSNRSHVLVTNDSDLDNFGFVELETNGASSWLQAQQKGTGTAPTEFRLFNFGDGISIENPITDNTNGQGSPTGPKTTIIHGSGDSATGLESASTTITADGTAQDVMSPGDPPFAGIHIIAGKEPDNFKTFCDVIIQVRNNTVSALSKVDGANSPAARSYSISGPTLQVAISDGSLDYTLADTFIGGGS